MVGKFPGQGSPTKEDFRGSPTSVARREFFDRKGVSNFSLIGRLGIDLQGYSYKRPGKIGLVAG